MHIQNYTRTPDQPQSAEYDHHKLDFNIDSIDLRSGTHPDMNAHMHIYMYISIYVNFEHVQDEKQVTLTANPYEIQQSRQ